MAIKYWFRIEFTDGSLEDVTNDGRGYDTYEEAKEEAEEWINDYHSGCDALGGDWTVDDDVLDYNIFDDDEEE